MSVTEPRQRTGAAQGDLWSAHARDWADHQEMRMRPLYEAGLDAAEIGQSTDHLDVGCGAGLVLQIAAGRGATVAGLDAAPGLIAIAHRRVPGARIEQGDAEELPFPDQSFDAVTGFNSFQYAATPLNALREAHRVLRPGGRLVAATWSPPEMCDLSAHLAAIGGLLPPPPPGAPGPFALSGDGALAALLAEAGFEPQQTRDVPCHFDYEDDDIALRALAASGPCVRAERHAGADATNTAIMQSVADHRQPDGSYRITNSFRLTLGIRH